MKFDCMYTTNLRSPGYQVAQIRCIFTIPKRARKVWFQNVPPPSTYLAYVERFTPFSSHPEANSGLYTTSRLVSHGERQAAVIPVEYIRRSVALLPKFGPIAPRDWTSSNVLERCPAFRVNPFTDRHGYATII